MLPSLSQAGNRLAQAIAPAAPAPAPARHLSRSPCRSPRPSLSRLAHPDAVLPSLRGRRRRGPQVPGPARPAGLGPLPRTARPTAPGPARARPPCALRRGRAGQAQRGLTLHGPPAPLPGRAPRPGLAPRLPARCRIRPCPHGFDVERSLPSRRQLGRVLRELDNAAAQFLLTATVQLIAPRAAARRRLRRCRRRRYQAHPGLGQGEQPQAVRRRPLRQDQTAQRRPGLQARLQETPQPGRGQRRPQPPRQRQRPPLAESHATPTTNPTPASHATVGEFHWGYASGVIATKVPDWGEFVLAELTQTFDKSDPSYFFPLMQQVEQRLGRRPRYRRLRCRL